MTDPLVRASDLRIDLGGTTILDGVSLTVDSGTFVGLIGPNGAGKTTLLRALNGALTPARGRVEVAGERIGRLGSKAASRLVATVPQDTSVSFDFDARETVRMGRTPHLSRFGGWSDEDAAAVERAMERTDVTGLADRAVTGLSGGERQRVLIARALAQATPLLLLDEPTASLDINHQVRTLELVRELVAEGKTAVAAIHDLNLAAHYCDELLLLSDGRVVAAGPPADVLTEANLEGAFGANAVVSRHPVTGSVYVTALPETRAGDAEGRVHVVGGGGTAARHLHILSAAGYDVSVGALNEGDTDTEAARSLGLDAVTVAPFSSVDSAARDAVAARVERADCVVVADVEVGRGNVANLRAAADADSLVLVEERPFAERNYAGAEGERVYERLRARGTVVSAGDVLAAVTAAVEGETESVETGTTTETEGEVAGDAEAEREKTGTEEAGQSDSSAT
ncbi:heme ABC transporter ATP-binding protein [Halopelagius fulvigenes]|uniref:Cobalamin import ATP-binding protein BtuD n=1 Tax=Halopelagius fulvigenes TaxID=1198324 RepID=A0ABD5U3S0_9EURY